jgi:hypothetical protein
MFAVRPSFTSKAHAFPAGLAVRASFTKIITIKG